MNTIQFNYKGYLVVLSDIIEVEGVNIGDINESTLLVDIQSTIDTYIEYLNS